MNIFVTRNFYLFIITFFIVLATFSCREELVDPKNEITSEDDAMIGSTIDNALLNYIDTSSGTTLLDKQTYPAIYSYIDQISQSINGSSSFTAIGTTTPNRPTTTNYTPTIRVIDAAGNTGAFVLPGGYIYLYKDFLKSIDYEAQFAPILAHLMTCSKNRYAIDKLETRFSTNFLIDLALGGSINGGSGTDICTILSALEDDPYPISVVELLDEEAEKTVCELSYDVQTYADWFIQNSNQNIKWYQQFPRTLSTGDYAAHLFNDVTDSLSCNGNLDEGGYPQFKSLLN